jgi:hypothetical protein
MSRSHDQIASEIIALLTSGQSVALVGPPSSRNEIIEHVREAVDERSLLLELDCHLFTDMTSAAFFEHCGHALRTLLATQGSSLAQPHTVSGPTRLAFEATLRQLAQRGRRLVLVLAGLEHLAASPHIDVSFFNALRSIAGRLPLALLTTSELPLIELTYAGNPDEIRSSPFFNIFAQIRIT